MKYLINLILILPITLFSQNYVERLENSPRHHEWKRINNNGKNINTFIVYPEVDTKVPAIILIHENRGLNDWARSMADQIAEMGYIVLAPDLLSETASNGGGTSDYANSDQARKAIYNLSPKNITSDLNSVFKYATNISASNGKVAIIGFCWGGSQSFSYATNNKLISAALVCYGTGPKNDKDYKKIAAPVYGFYGGNDNRVNATIEKSNSAMNKANALFEPIIYNGAGHGFFRAGEQINASKENKKARIEGLKRIKEILSKL
ncbi:MAG: dienelactone hydrolase family protein [Flavobacteriaceae bacterium]|nr:dienelactone hydrolase family protein [Flavobacteriaceae bacterium]